MGAGFIETDLQLSRDARFVAIHDATVNRTTNGQGAVHDMTLAELRKLDAGSWFGSEYAGERIPTVVQFDNETSETRTAIDIAHVGVDSTHQRRTVR